MRNRYFADIKQVFFYSDLFLSIYFLSSLEFSVLAAFCNICVLKTCPNSFDHHFLVDMNSFQCFCTAWSSRVYVASLSKATCLELIIFCMFVVQVTQAKSTADTVLEHQYFVLFGKRHSLIHCCKKTLLFLPFLTRFQLLTTVV